MDESDRRMSAVAWVLEASCWKKTDFVEPDFGGEACDTMDRQAGSTVVGLAGHLDGAMWGSSS